MSPRRGCRRLIRWCWYTCTRACVQGLGEFTWPLARPCTAGRNSLGLRALYEPAPRFVINNCIDAVISGETRISADEVSVKELSEFVESMSSQQYQSIADYVQNMPQLEDTVNFTCSNCGHENNRKLKGISDFFS